MENIETIKITPRIITESVTKLGKPWWSIQTSLGHYSCFDRAIIDKLKVGVESAISVQTNAQGYKAVKEVLKDMTFDSVMAKAEPVDDARERKERSMYVSYVKDLVIAGKSVDEAIEVIKKALAEF